MYQVAADLQKVSTQVDETSKLIGGDCVLDPEYVTI